MRECSLITASLVAVTVLTVTVALEEPVQAQTPRPPRGASASLQRITTAPPIDYRGLTINRQPQEPVEPLGGDRNIYQDGPIRYNDIRNFSPSPYTTSGVQYPYGLDGIGGFGSDLGFASGQDSALYNRGAGSLR